MYTFYPSIQPYIHYIYMHACHSYRKSILMSFSCFLFVYFSVFHNYTTEKYVRPLFLCILFLIFLVFHIQCGKKRYYQFFHVFLFFTHIEKIW